MCLRGSNPIYSITILFRQFKVYVGYIEIFAPVKINGINSFFIKKTFLL